MIQKIRVNGQQCSGLIDTGCSRSIVSPKIFGLADKVNAHSKGEIFSFDGRAVPHEGEVEVLIEVAGRPVRVNAIRCAKVIEGADCIVLWAWTFLAN